MSLKLKLFSKPEKASGIKNQRQNMHTNIEKNWLNHVLILAYRKKPESPITGDSSAYNFLVKGKKKGTNTFQGTRLAGLDIFVSY